MSGVFWSIRARNFIFGGTSAAAAADLYPWRGAGQFAGNFMTRINSIFISGVFDIKRQFSVILARNFVFGGTPAAAAADLYPWRRARRVAGNLKTRINSIFISGVFDRKRLFTGIFARNFVFCGTAAAAAADLRAQRGAGQFADNLKIRINSAFVSGPALWPRSFERSGKSPIISEGAK